MNKTKAKTIFATVWMAAMVVACGKSMNLQVNGPLSQNSQNQEAVGTETSGSDFTKKNSTVQASLATNEELQPYSAYDMKNLTSKPSDSVMLKRSTLQVPPKSSVKGILSLSLNLKNAKLGSSGKATLCLGSDLCKTLDSDSIKSDLVELDLREIFDLCDKSDAEIMDWIYEHSSEFADHGYRKFLFSFEGITFDSGSLLIQVTTNDELPDDFSTLPTQYVHGEEDLHEPEGSVVGSS